MIVALLLLGAAYAVLGVRSSAPGTDRTRSELQRLASDAVTVLGGVRDDRGRALDLDLLEAIHCSYDITPSTTSCLDGMGANLSLKIGSYLPSGTAYAIFLDNGFAAREVFDTGAPVGEAVSSSVAYAPDWNFTFVIPELSCYDTRMAVNATLVPVVNGAFAAVTSGHVLLDDDAGSTAIASTTLTGAWNVSLDLTARPAASDVSAVLTSKRSTLPGVGHYASCVMDSGVANATMYALRNASAVASPAIVSAGDAVALSANLAPLAAVSGITIGPSWVTVYDPLPGRPNQADTWVVSENASLPTGTTPSTTWDVPMSAAFGVHLVVVSTNVTIGSTTFQARSLTTVTVALPSGVVPIEPPYRVELQVWSRDWR